MSVVAASPIILHLSDNPEEICVDFGPHLKSGETLASGATLVGYVVNGAIQATVTGLSIASLAINTSGTFTSPDGNTVTQSEGITAQVTPSAVGTYYAVFRATSSDSPRKPALTQEIQVRYK